MRSGFVVKSKESGSPHLAGRTFSMTLFRLFTCTLTGAVAIAAASSLVWLGRRKKTPEQREALRRQRISAQGRITDGTVLDVQEFDHDGGHPVQMVIYTYDVAGVQYECSQDVTPLRQFLDLHSCRIGVAASIKYDPAPSRQLNRRLRKTGADCAPKRFLLPG